jgi:tetratricopeptide (TPR) repeat protein
VHCSSLLEMPTEEGQGGVIVRFRLILLLTLLSLSPMGSFAADGSFTFRDGILTVSQEDADSMIANEQAARLGQGVALANSGKLQDAIVQYYDPVIATYESAYADKAQRYYSSRTVAEGLMYAGEAANAHTAAMGLSKNWAYAHFLKGYALVDLGQLDPARTELETALQLSPHNAQFLSELANLDYTQMDNAKALQLYQRAETDTEFSPPQSKDLELSRAWRGQGFVYIRMKRLDDAEKLYRQCLALDSNDKRALQEIQYIHSQREWEAKYPTTDAATSGSSLSSALSSAIFEYGRTGFFRTLIGQFQCDSSGQGRIGAANDRFEKARVRLAAKYGGRFFALDAPDGGPTRPHSCDPATLTSYEAHIAEVEKLLDH